MAKQTARQVAEQVEEAKRKNARETLLAGIADLSIECHAGILTPAGNELVLNISYEEACAMVSGALREGNPVLEFRTFSWKADGMNAEIEPFDKLFVVSTIMGVLEVTTEQWEKILFDQSERMFQAARGRIAPA